MGLYRMLIKPQINYPDQYYNPVCRNLEQDEKWYPEEEKEAIKEKYKHLENTFEQVVFDVKYEPIDAIPVEWLEKLMLSTGDDVDKVELAWIMREWQKEQEG